jgi:hypothetical protein
MLQSRQNTITIDSTDGQMSEFLLQLRWSGRFGNRMFQYAYGATYARLTGLEFWLPADWEGTRLFKHQIHKVVDNDEIRLALTLPDEVPYQGVATRKRMQAVQKYYPDAELIDAELAPDPYLTPGHPVCHATLCAYNRALLARVSKRHLKSLCEFSDQVTRLEAYKRYSDIQGLYDVAHLRRDDISDAQYNRAHSHSQGYSVISKDSYSRAFRKFGYPEESIEWVSDDYTGRWHVGRKVRFRGGWEYPSGSQYIPGMMFDWLGDFLKLYFARTIFRANSSFSWWAALLSPTAKVFSPVLGRRHVYGVDGMEEIAVDFVEGNHPAWMHGRPELVLGE